MSTATRPAYDLKSHFIQEPFFAKITKRTETLSSNGKLDLDLVSDILCFKITQSSNDKCSSASSTSSRCRKSFTAAKWDRKDDTVDPHRLLSNPEKGHKACLVFSVWSVRVLPQNIPRQNLICSCHYFFFRPHSLPHICRSSHKDDE